MDDTPKTPKKTQLKRGRKRKDFTITEGIEPLVEERYVGFGSLVINKPMLIRDSKLSVKYKQSLTSLKKIPVKKISPEFRDIIKTILEEHKINHRLLSQLGEEEKDLFSNLIRLSHLESRLGLDGYRSFEQDKQLKRFELLKGEILAGNNNKEILKELKNMVIKFMENGTISKSEGGMILAEIMVVL